MQSSVAFRVLLLAAALPVLAGEAAPPPAPTPAQPAEPTGADLVKARYTKFEYRIPMRDGARLLTAVYVPKDATPESGKKYPILLTRTPYGVGPYGADNYRAAIGPSDLFQKEGYVFAYQDVRGRWMSEGEYVNVRPVLQNRGPKDVDETTDTWDTIDWLVRNVAGSTGKVGMWGISYPGFYTSVALVDPHPALLAASPQAPIADWFTGDDFHHNGAFFPPHFFLFFSSFGVTREGPTKKREKRYDIDTPDGYRYYLGLPPVSQWNGKLLGGKAPFIDDVARHGTYDDFWKARNLRPRLKNVKPAVLTVGGWFDAENLYGSLQTYRSLETQSPAAARNYLVMGPWIHGGWGRNDGDALGPIRFGTRTSLWYREHLELPFFEFFLKGKGDARPAEATVFETGTNRWRSWDAWPPPSARPVLFHFREGGLLSREAPVATEALDEFVSDPARPVPYTAQVSIGMTQEYETEDQRFASTRPDVLVYETPALERDVLVAGPTGVDLWVSTTGTDADWVVKLVDVWPDDAVDPDPNPQKVRMGGYQQLVRGDVMRGKFRNSFEKPEPFEPGRPARIRFALNDVNHVFRSGHRIMVQLQSSWFPLVDRNPQVFTDIYVAPEDAYRKATHRLHRTKEMPSSVTLSIVD